MSRRQKRKRQVDEQDPDVKFVNDERQFYKSAIAPLDVLKFDKVCPTSSSYIKALSSCAQQMAKRYEHWYKLLYVSNDTSTKAHEIYVDMCQRVITEYCGPHPETCITFLIDGLSFGKNGQFEGFWLDNNKLMPLIELIKSQCGKASDVAAARYWTHVLDLFRLARSDESDLCYQDKHYANGNIMNKYVILKHKGIVHASKPCDKYVHQWILRVAPITTLQELINAGFCFLYYHVSYAFGSMQFDKFDLVCKTLPADKHGDICNLQETLRTIVHYKHTATHPSQSTLSSPWYECEASLLAKMEDRHVRQFLEYAMRVNVKDVAVSTDELYCIYQDCCIQNLNGSTDSDKQKPTAPIEQQVMRETSPPLLDWICRILLSFTTHFVVAPSRYRSWGCDASRYWLMVGIGRQVFSTLKESVPLNINDSLTFLMVDFMMGLRQL